MLVKKYGYKKLCIILCIAALSLGCAAPELRTSTLEAKISNTALVWPPQPQTPRIQFVKSISGPSDIGAEKSWFKKAVDTIFGKDEIEGIILRPYGVFTHKEKIYVTDPGIHVLHIFDIKNKRYLKIHNVKGEDLISPIGIAVDKNEEIYFSDSMLKKIFVLDKEGSFLRNIGSPEMFSRPTGIAVDEDRIYVADAHAHHVSAFAKKDGTFLFSFGKNGNGKGDFHYPTNIFIGKDNQIYITDSMNFRVQIFDRNGKFQKAFGKHGDGSGDFSKPKGIAVDSEGHIYVADADFDIVQIFDRDGKLLLAFGNSGVGEGEMFLPAGIYIDEDDRIYVADSYNGRIQIFQYLKAMK